MEPVKLFQYNTLGALMAGLYGGSFTIGELLEHGDLGVWYNKKIEIDKEKLH